MPKLILTFKDINDLNAWYTAYLDQGGEQEIYNGLEANDEVDLDKYEQPVITEED